MMISNIVQKSRLGWTFAVPFRCLYFLFVIVIRDVALAACLLIISVQLVIVDVVVICLTHALVRIIEVQL
jgi:hypothetical protein